MPHSLTSYLNSSEYNDGGLPINTILRALPPGWVLKFSSILMDLDERLKSFFVELAIRDGVLYLSQHEQAEYRQITELVIRSLSQESARTCMVCGERGLRRKEQEHKPCLCRTHYLDFINYTEE
jgi:hypothetical protein